MRKGSVVSESGGCYLQYGAYRGKGIGILTSGGDSQGMNSCLRACVRTGIYMGCRVFLIHEGFQGLVDGGYNIEIVDWASVSSIIHLGGTVIGSARCSDFREREGRVKAAKNMITHGLTNLVIIGGDGSLTGAYIFRREWPSILDELLAKGEITPEEKQNNRSLHVVGVLASIDNDFCGTDMTIGTDSALHRIQEAVDSIVSTASSHQRLFVLEVMGRNCGYLSVSTAITCQADFVFCPELPPPPDWPEILAKKLKQERSAGQRLGIVIVSEGAVDADGNVITAEQVKQIIVDKVHKDSRAVVLGHVQRGGLPSAFDRVLGCRQGAAAVMAVMDSTKTDDAEPVVITIRSNRIVIASLMECVDQTHAVVKAMEEKNFTLAAQLRGEDFIENLRLVSKMTSLLPEQRENSDCLDGSCRRFGILNLGNPAGGMNAVVVSFVRCCLMQGDVPIGISDSIDGLIMGHSKRLTLADVVGRVIQAGSFLGSKRGLAERHFKEIAYNLGRLRLNGLVLVGGYDAFLTCVQLTRQRGNFPEFRIPMIVLPATISNNVPGTDHALGCDTSINEITQVCDRIRTSAQGTKHRVFIIETMGGHCGYLPTIGGIAAGADAAYIFEEKFNATDLVKDVRHMASKMREGVQRGLVLCSEKASKNYNTDFIFRLYAEEGKDTYSCRKNILGHFQQGGTPTPFDRKHGLKMGMECVSWLTKINQAKPGFQNFDSDEASVVMGMTGRSFIYTAVEELVLKTDMENHVPLNEWWMKFRPLLRVMAKHPSAYTDESLKPSGMVDINCSVN